MTVKLETPHGTFAAESEEEALKAARKAKRQAAKAERQEQADRQQASVNSRLAGFRVLSRVLDGQPERQGWRVYRPGEKWFPACQSEDCYQYFRLETEHGTAELQLYRSLSDPLEFVGALMDGAGYWVAIWLADKTSGTSPYCIGIHNGQVVIERLPVCISMELFRGSEQDGKEGA